MPALAFGTWKIDKDTTADMVYQAIEHGYRHIDTACDYGNEKEVGEGIRRALHAGIIESREHLWVTSKLWCTHHKKEHVKEGETRQTLIFSTQHALVKYAISFVAVKALCLHVFVFSMWGINDVRQIHFVCLRFCDFEQPCSSLCPTLVWTTWTSTTYTFRLPLRTCPSVSGILRAGSSTRMPRSRLFISQKSRFMKRGALWKNSWMKEGLETLGFAMST
jgi:hypothetical protein